MFNGVDYVLQIRSVGSSNIRHDVILRDVEFIMNEDLATLVDIKAAESNNLDLGKIYKDAQDLSRKWNLSFVDKWIMNWFFLSQDTEYQNSSMKNLRCNF